MRCSEKIDQIAAAIVKFQGEMPIIKKTDPVNAGTRKWKYAPYEELYRPAQPLLLKHGLGIIFGAVREVNGVEMLEATVIHTSGQWLIREFPLVANQPTSQGYGAANTYSKRALFSNIFNIVTEGEDDDGQKQQQEYHSSLYRASPRHSQSSRSFAGHGEKDIQPRDPNKPISDKQRNLLRMQMGNKNNLESIICNKLQIDTLTQLTMGQFDEALKIAKWLHENMK